MEADRDKIDATGGATNGIYLQLWLTYLAPEGKPMLGG
jgi:hypothetical protein